MTSRSIADDVQHLFDVGDTVRARVEWHGKYFRIQPASPPTTCCSSLTWTLNWLVVWVFPFPFFLPP